MHVPDLIDPSFTDALDGLALQLSAGVQLERALRSAGPINRTAAGRAAFELARERVARGEPFDRVLEAMASMLSYPDRAMLAAGWEGGRIDPALKQVIERRELMHATRRQIRRQMLLPAVVLVAAAFIAPLPPLLLGNIGTTAYLFRALPPLVIAAGLWIAVRTIQRAAAARWTDWRITAAPPPATVVDQWLLRLPLTRGIERKRNLSEFAMLMSNLLSAGVGLIDALAITARALPNGVYREHVVAVGKVVMRGGKMSEGMRGARGVWPDEWIDALEVGEATGEEDRVLDRLAQSMRESYIATIQAWGTWLPRVVYVAVSAYVVVQILSMWGAILAGR